MTTSTDKRRHKERLYQLFSQVATAMSNPHRLELLDLLVQAPRTVEELAQEAHMSVANTSQHLQRLKQAKLVLNEREGLYIRYRLADPAVARLWLELRAVAEQQLAEVERTLDAYRHRRHEFEGISSEELRSWLRHGEVVLLDVRPAAEYEAGHLPEAISIPIDELERRLHELPPNKLIVAYCRGPYCVYADDALGLLAERGWQVARLEEGIAEWREAGYKLAA
ncbi:MAG: ArsR family transcriptional regulator [Anaerolineae bacterium]|nr:metalloregulator ArsR/SmtB family transcription factor [Anaerolineae bacterium]MCQ3978039.1 ArsR family transcriptional regulator [Anaerolineae bacterium]GIK38994.1 MAG: transcriptional regulator [Chloroflexota bacterium]